MEYAVLSVLGVVGGLGLFKAWQAGSRQEPGASPAPTVTARVVEAGGPMPEAEILRMLQAQLAQKGQMRALEREAERMIEAQAGAVIMPWATKAPDPPKA